MSRKNRPPLADRVVRAAEAALAAQHYVSPVDVFLGLGWLNPNTARYWQRGQIACLEDTLPDDRARILEAFDLLEGWAAGKGLLANEADYIARTPQRPQLRFSRSGHPALERRYRTHWLSPALSERRRERLVEKRSRPPELVVVIPLKDDWTCHGCGQGGGWLVMENTGPACLRCVALDDLDFLAAGDALLTRRARAKSARQAVVVRSSPRRSKPDDPSGQPSAAGGRDTCRSLSRSLFRRVRASRCGRGMPAIGRKRGKNICLQRVVRLLTQAGQ